MNARELLAAVADWLGWQDEDMSYGLKSGEDALKLYAYAQAHDELGEMADEWEPKDRKKALGYDPLAVAFDPARKTKYTNRSPQVVE
jgi:hypothetical protein